MCLAVARVQAAYITRPQHVVGNNTARGSQVQQPADASGSTVPPGLHPHAIQLPASQEAAALARKQWFMAFMVVGLTHVAALGVSMALRYPVISLLSTWVQGTDGLQRLGVVLALLLPLALALEGVMSLLSSRATSNACITAEGGVGSTVPAGSNKLLGQQHSAVDMRKVFVVELSLVAAVLAAVACINWALGYVACLLLVPFVVGSSAGGATSLNARAMQVVVLACCSPLSVLLMLSAWAPGIGLASTFNPAWLSWLLHGSSFGTYFVVCAVYLPCWLLAVALHAA